MEEKIQNIPIYSMTTTFSTSPSADRIGKQYKMTTIVTTRTFLPNLPRRNSFVFLRESSQRFALPRRASAPQISSTVDKFDSLCSRFKLQCKVNDVIKDNAYQVKSYKSVQQKTTKPKKIVITEKIT